MIKPESGKCTVEMDLAPFKELLLSACGNSFDGERELVLRSVIGRRMALAECECLTAYLALLMKDRNELQQVIELLMNNVSYFLREPAYLELVLDSLLPEFQTPSTRSICLFQ